MVQKIDNLEFWAFGALGIANPETSTLKQYFDLISLTEKVDGDIAELGVSKGASIVTTGLLLEALGSHRNVMGFDTFSGFPNYSEMDNFSNFQTLYQNGQISEEHWFKVQLNREFVAARGADVSPGKISNSSDFSETSKAIVENKITYFQLGSRIILIEGDFTKNLENELVGKSLSLVLLDSDLFDSYELTLPHLWRSLTPGGYIYLDEYYSLKFPGPRFAVDEFAKNSECELILLGVWLGFERWALRKRVTV
jgi:hypothetical protein